MAAKKNSRVRCDEVTLTDEEGESVSYFVQYETPRDDADKAAVLAELAARGYEADVATGLPILGPKDDPAVSWRDLSDIVD